MVVLEDGIDRSLCPSQQLLQSVDGLIEKPKIVEVDVQDGRQVAPPLCVRQGRSQVRDSGQKNRVALMVVIALEHELVPVVGRRAVF